MIPYYFFLHNLYEYLKYLRFYVIFVSWPRFRPNSASLMNFIELNVTKLIPSVITEKDTKKKIK